MRASDARQLTRMRLAAQRISRPTGGSPADVVRWMTAMQAQDFPGAKWSIGLRSPGTTDADIEAELTAGRIVRSWPMRGTLHVVAPEDLGWMLQLTTERLLSEVKGRQRALELTAADFERARAAAIDALSGGRWLSREDMHGVFEGAGVATAGQRGYHVLWYLSQTGTLCFGPPQGSKQTFVLLDEWVPRPRLLDPDEALGEFALRYFRSHGPATVSDFARWASLTMGTARKGLAMAREHLVSWRIEETDYFHGPDAESASGPDGTHALPGFDEYLLGYRDRSPQLAPEHAARIVPGGNGMFKATVVHNGSVIGTWSRSASTKGIRIEASPLSPWSRAARTGFARAASRYAAFVGSPLIAVDEKPALA